MISLRAFPINAPPVGARAEAGRQVPGLSQPPDRPSRPPVPACRRRPHRCSPACHPPAAEGSERVPAARGVRRDPEPGPPAAASLYPALEVACDLLAPGVRLPHPHTKGVLQRDLPSACKTECRYFGNHRQMGNRAACSKGEI